MSYKKHYRFFKNVRFDALIKIEIKNQDVC